MRIIIAGSRTYNDYEEAMQVINKFIRDLKFTEDINSETVTIISGGAKGADRIGEEYAIRNGLDRVVYKANWGKYGKQAGIIRNGEMAKNGDCLLAFWDGESRGTYNMINTAKKRRLRVRVFNYLNKGVTDYGNEF